MKTVALWFLQFNIVLVNVSSLLISDVNASATEIVATNASTNVKQRTASSIDVNILLRLFDGSLLPTSGS